MGMYDYEGMFYDQGIYHVAGVDEVGRGPYCGACHGSCCYLATYDINSRVWNDSKS